MFNFLKYCLVVITIFATPIKGLLALVYIAVVADTAFAIYASIKLRGWKSFSSTKLFNIVVKTFFYMSTILFAFLIDTYMLDGKIFDITNIISKTITFVWLYIELKSIDETSQKLGYRSFGSILREVIGKTKGLKKDINDIKY